MIANNSGQPGRIRTWSLSLELKKQATGSFDPSLSFTGRYAIDEATAGTIIKQACAS
jgi:hypothetical protein